MSLRLPDRDPNLLPGQLGERERAVFNRLANTQLATTIVVIALLAVVIYAAGRTNASISATLVNRQAAFGNRALECAEIVLREPYKYTIAALPTPCQDPNVAPLIVNDPNVAPFLAPSGTRNPAAGPNPQDPFALPADAVPTTPQPTTTTTPGR